MKRSLWRTIGHWVLVIFAAWLVGAGLIAWVTAEGRVLGILQAIRLGVPAWHLIIPVYGVANLIVLWTCRPGAYWYLAIGHFVFTFGVGLPLVSGWTSLEARTGLDVTIWSALIFGLALIVSLVAIFMALGEALPLGTLAARLIYAGRVGHLRGLFRLAQARGWQATGPQAPDHSVFVSGRWEGRDIAIQSGERLSYGADAGHFYWVTVAAKSVLPPMGIAIGRPLPKPDDRRHELRGKCHTAGKLMMDFYVWPQEGQSLAPDVMDRLAQVLERGRRFLRARSVIYTEYNAITYGQMSSFRITDNEEQMVCLIGWLSDLASVLERELVLAPSPEAEPAPDLISEPASASTTPLPAEPESAPLGPSSLAGRALLALLLTIGFYGLTLIIAGALLFIVYADLRWASRPQFQIIFGCLVAAGAILWAIRPRIDRFVAPGPRLLPAEHPRLFSELETVARQTGQAMPREVYLVADANAAVMERGGVMGIGGKRVMIVGLPFLQTLTVSQFRSVIAHEFGHFCGGDTKLSPWVYKTRAAIGRTIESLGNRSWLQAPFRWYGQMFLRTTHAISRRQEFIADALAAKLVGPQICAEGLRIGHSIGPAFDGYMREEYIPALENGYRPPFVEGFGRFLRAPRVSEFIEFVVTGQAQEQRSDPYDTHPTLSERLKAVAALPACEIPADPAPAISLLGDVTAAEAALVSSIVQPDYRDKLQPVAWDDIGQVIYLPGWQESVRNHAAGLTGVTPASLPDFLAAPAPLAEQIRQRSERTLLQQEIESLVRNITGAALAVALAHQGWVVDATPGIPITLRRGDDAVAAFEVTHLLAAGKLAGAEWAERCHQLGIADLNLAGE